MTLDHFRPELLVNSERQPRWTAKDVAKYLSVPVKRVYEMGLPEIRLGERTIRYDPADVIEWERERKSRWGNR